MVASALIVALAGCGTDSSSGQPGSTVSGTGTKTSTDTPTNTQSNTGTPTTTDTNTSSRTSTGGTMGSRTDTNTATDWGDAGVTTPGDAGVTTPRDAGVTTPDVAPDASADSPVVAIYEIGIAPIRALDLVFMIDNSPSMAPKAAKMNAQFPKLLAALKDPSDGTYPDLRVALIDSDLGTGGAYANGSCGPNDGNGQSAYGDLGNFQMRGATDCGMTSADALWIEYTKGSPVNYGPGKDINAVFACLATNLGTIGCGEEHSLQAFEFALVAQNLHADKYAPQNNFLRPEAYLGLVFISDEDDCSAATNDGMFGDKAELRGESAILRCATRGHQCSGQNLATSGPGYPTTASFTANFQDCAARMDACPNQTDGDGATDTSVPTSCSPLKSIGALAREIRDLKGDQGSERILVAGIFGWPRSGDTASPVYKIDLAPNPNSSDTTHAQVYDYWPVCYDPNHMPRSSGFDADAWGWGAQGGLRLSAFIDQFGDNGLKYSICEPDFSDAMKGIGNALARKLQNLCVPSDFGQGKDCTASYYRPVVDANGNMTFVADPSALPLCASNTPTPDTDCYAIVTDPALCPGAQSRVDVRRTARELASGPLPEGTKIGFRCQ